LESLPTLTEVRNDYLPHFAIDARFNSVAFGGYMLYLKQERAKRNASSGLRNR